MKKIAVYSLMVMLLMFSYATVTEAASTIVHTNEEVAYLAAAHEHNGGEHDHSGGQSLMVAMRIADITAAIAVAGVLFFRYILWRSEEQAPGGFSLKAERIAMLTAAIVWLATGLARLMMLSDQLGGIPISTIATSTLVGQVSVTRPAGAIIVLLLAFAPRKEQVWARPMQYVAALALMVTFPLTGHANGAEEGVLGLIVAHTVHIAAAAIWIGGLAGIFSLAGKPSGIQRLNEVTTRFSKWALPSTVLIILSACWLAFAQITSYKQLFSNQYGFLLLAKVFLMLLVIVIGALHRLWFMPAIEAAASPNNPPSSGIAGLFAQGGHAADNSKTVQRMLAGVRAEIVAAICLIVVAGWLSSTPPPNSDTISSAEPVHWHEMGEEVHMTLRLSGGYETEEQLARLYVWLPEGIGAPESTMVKIESLDPEKAGEAPIEIPFELDPDEENKLEFPGFLKYNYSAKGAFADLLVPNKAIVDVKDSLGNEFHFEKTVGGPS